ncbi:MAG: transcriptional regulator [Bacteroidales bacterium]|nr:transcriptional regulator [Candidatus Cacconaster equi]MCQ2157036.1 transcriptional regulator [Bacteroidales bacterium]
MSMNDWVLVSPAVTNAEDWIKGRIIDIENNPFNGVVITVQTADGLILWERAKYFKPIS